MQFRNWFTVLSVYVITLVPELRVPLLVNPTVESTLIIEESIGTVSNDLELGIGVKSPLISLISSRDFLSLLSTT